MKVALLCEDSRLGKWVNPNDLWDNRPNGAVAIIYFGGDELWHKVNAQHSDLIRAHGLEYSYNMWNDLAKDGLFGRIGVDGGTKVVTFWNNDQELYDKLLRDCIVILMKRGLINRSFLVSTPLLGSVAIADVLGHSAKSRGLSDEEQEKLEMQKRLHLMPADQKRDAMKKLGLASGSKKGDMQREFEKIGGVSPGQKWWAPYSEDHINEIANAMED